MPDKWSAYAKYGNYEFFVLGQPTGQIAQARLLQQIQEVFPNIEKVIIHESD